MKLIIQIPCYNEEKTLPKTLADLPEKIEGIDEIEILVIDDGSEDETVNVARKHGVGYIARFNKKAGLARAFKAGLEEALRCGADIIVNTDADNQYRASYINDLIQPILNGEADIVIGDRQLNKKKRQPILKRMLQSIGSRVVSKLAGVKVKDATSGFRAFSKEAALQLNIVNDFSYTLESIIQAAEKGLMIKNVPIETNKELRPSRLFKNNFHYIKRQLAVIIKIYVAYEGFLVFVATGSITMLLGFVFIARFLYYYFTGINPSGHIQSLIIASILVVVGLLIVMLGLLVDLVCSTRRLIEDNILKLQKFINKQKEE
jgi:glycosyltransferase involved in cell wall biosynthesis